jgi:hypothetical protein
MAQTSQDIWNQMQGIMDQYNTYTPTSGGDVYSDLASRVGYFKPQYQELANQESQAYAAPASLMQNYRTQQAQNPGGYGPDALSQLTGVLGQIGNMYGTADVMRGTIGNAQGRLEQMSQNALDQYTQAKESTLNKYNMLAPVWNQYRSEEQAAQDRAWQEQQNAMDRQTQQNIAAMNQQSQSNYQALIDMINSKLYSGGATSETTIDPVDQAYNDYVANAISKGATQVISPAQAAYQKTQTASKDVWAGNKLRLEPV